MMDEAAYWLDIDGLRECDELPADDSGTDRPWVGIRFDCCGVYVRVYRNPAATAYETRCPKCLRQVRLRVGQNGTNARLFVAE